MPRMIISPEGVEITNRFFEVIDMLRLQKKIRGLKTITDEVGANQGNTQFIKTDPSSHVLKPELLAYLVRKYNVSAEWLLCGTGEIFKTMISLTDEEKRTRQVLIDYASRREGIRYENLIEKAQLNLSMKNPHHRGLLGKILGNISQYEFEHGRPLLSSVAILQDMKKKHSDGFFKLAADLGLGNWQTLKKSGFDNTEMTRTFNYWQHNKE